MSRLGRFPLFALLLCLSGAALGACQALAGIDDRVYPSPQCVDYCTRIMQLCPRPYKAYAEISNCFGICALLPAGIANEPAPDNSLNCRLRQLDHLDQLGGPNAEPSDLVAYCARSGPGGSYGPDDNGPDGPRGCGTNCESYCQLYKAACQAANPSGVTTAQYSLAPDGGVPDGSCVAACQGLKDAKSAEMVGKTGSEVGVEVEFDTTVNYTHDTLQCRLVHTSAATLDPKTHCVHAELQPQPTTPCQDPDTDGDAGADADAGSSAWPDCDSFCHLEIAECRDDQKIYESPQQCIAVCNALRPGSPTDTTGNTVGCRKYHSYNAIGDAPTHCQHTGPGSEGLCVDAPASTAEGNCQSYCLLLQQACPSDFKSDFKNETTCEMDCAKLDPPPTGYSYSVAPGNVPTGNNVECRLLHVSRALLDPTECAAATGAAACK